MERMFKYVTVYLMIYLAGFLPVLAVAQSTRPLDPGKAVPDMALELHNGNTIQHVHLSDFKGKLVIIDIWGTHCGSCIASLPHMLELQNELKDQLQVIIMDDPGENESDVKALWAKMSADDYDTAQSNAIIYAGNSLPFVYGSKTLDSLFPTTSIPSHVWIDQQGIFYGQALNTTTTSKNIKLFLIGTKVKLALNRHDPNFNPEYYNPVNWMNSKPPIAPLLNYSIFMGRVADSRSSDDFYDEIKDSVTGLLSGIVCVNMSMVDFYRKAYFRNGSFKTGLREGWFPDSRIIIESDKSPDNYFVAWDAQNYIDWIDSNMFCYALKTQMFGDSLILNAMKRDLDHFFHFTARTEQRAVKTFVLKRISSEDRLNSKGGPEKKRVIHYKGKEQLVIRNMNYQQFQNSMSTWAVQFRTIVLADSTGFNKEKKIDIAIPWSDDFKTISVEDMRKGLRSYGIDMVEEMTPPMEVLVLHQDGYVKK
jgi:thiol-disulfide isomerase/thioredoxin